MTPIFLARRHALDNKPAHGAPCNRCGLCCLATACELGQHVFRRPAWNGSPRPGLAQTSDGSHLCQVAANPTPHIQKSRVLGSGITCLKNAARLIIGADDGYEPASIQPYFDIDLIGDALSHPCIITSTPRAG